jgi:hypothetical protein
MENIGGKIVICCMFTLFLLSCDTSVPLIGSGRQYAADCGTLTISGSKFGSSLFVTSFFKGSFVVQPDSLKLSFLPEYVTVKNLTFSIGYDEQRKNNGSFQISNNSVTVHIAIFSETPVSLDTVTMLVSPCDFIMCNDEPLLTDTIKISLK